MWISVSVSGLLDCMLVLSVGSLARCVTFSHWQADQIVELWMHMAERRKKKGRSCHDRFNARARFERAYRCWYIYFRQITALHQ
ncbi:hypothetical protein C8F01DRAFT_269905 [Mycena amicta]|nr:hypothetical protein C8F01DRAFT_269905 [Mycena amicta]